MLAYVGKSLVWIIASVVGLTVGVSAFVLNKSTSPDTTGASHWLLPKFPQLPQLPQLPHHAPPPAVPEVNTGLVLLPIVLAILFFTSRHLLGRRGLENQ
jgi:hypothetical protein